MCMPKSYVYLVSLINVSSGACNIHLFYCNSLYDGISQAYLNKIQRIQNKLVRVVINTSKFEHITPILEKIHWLPIKQAMSSDI